MTKTARYTRTIKWLTVIGWAGLVVARGTGFIDPNQLIYTLDAILITGFIAEDLYRFIKAENAKKEKAE